MFHKFYGLLSSALKEESCAKKSMVWSDVELQHNSGIGQTKPLLYGGVVILTHSRPYASGMVSDSEHMTGIRIEFLKPTGQGYGTLQMQRYNKLLREIPYPASDGKTVFEQCGTKMIISYISPGGSSNGLYARYSRGIQSCNSGSLPGHFIFYASLFTLLRIANCETGSKIF
ncbi:hypothetical protein Y032_0254g300 [Ancylostoma ceylanicum]|nr:hypothetical protein Y032_0254g300 [Ancylostoma ceylanicum]